MLELVPAAMVLALVLVLVMFGMDERSKNDQPPRMAFHYDFAQREMRIYAATAFCRSFGLSLEVAKSSETKNIWNLVNFLFR